MLKKSGKLFVAVFLSLCFTAVVSCTPQTSNQNKTKDISHKSTDNKSNTIKSEFAKIKGFSGEYEGEFIKLEIKEYNDDYNFILFTYSAVAEGLEHANKKGKIYPDKMEIFLESFGKANFKIKKTNNGYTILMNGATLNSF